MPGDTIAAVATPPGQGGIAVIRLSGPHARAIVERHFVTASGPVRLAPRRVYVGRVLAGSGGATLDQVLVFSMPGPRSYTGEDVVEVQCHGGSVLTRRILEALLTAGARPAAPGEFTKRAFLNGRLDLAQAEAVADLIAARSEAGVRLAWSQLDGQLSARVGALRARVLEARALCEAAIDFPEDDLPELSAGRMGAELARVRAELETLICGFERTRVRYEGARAVLVGKPNVGKSSLLNALAGRARAIVTPLAGTTRDIVEAQLTLDGTPVLVADAAGLRVAGDDIERLGVERTHAAIVDAACVVAVFDRSRPFDDDDRLVARASAGRSPVVALNKADLAPCVAPADLVELLAAETAGHDRGIVEVSAVAGSGVEALATAIAARLADGDDRPEDEVAIYRARHRDAARRAAEDLARAEVALASSAPVELIASDLASAARALAGITGEITSDDVLDRVFAEFCIGK
jgi:tRNA modification GTPase